MVNYSLIYDLLTRLHYNLNRTLTAAKSQIKKPSSLLEVGDNQQELLNQVVTLTQLLNATQDLKMGFG